MYFLDADMLLILPRDQSLNQTRGDSVCCHALPMATLADRRHTARASLDTYTNPRSLYAFHTYDVAPSSHREQLGPDDVLAANLLSLRLSGRSVTQLFAEGNGPAQVLMAAMNRALVDLQDAKPFEEYESTDELDTALRALMAANEATEGVPAWTAVTVSKVLHRHLPNIVPIIDSRVRAFYGVRKTYDLRHRLWADIRENRDWLTDLTRNYRTPDDRPLSLLRAADIVIWTPNPE